MSGKILSVLLCAVCTMPVGFAADEEEAAPKRKPAQVMSYRGAGWLERSTRDEEEQPYKVIGAMKLKEGDVVADIGVGTGYYARKIARVVGAKGTVYGVDIQPEMLEMLIEFCKRQKIENIKPILGDFNDPKLPKESLDWIILTDVYHEFSHPEAMLAKMLEALKPTGKVLLLEYRLDGETARHIKIDHRMSVKQVKSEWLPAGFELLELEEFLPSQHLFIFGKAKPKE